MIFITMKDENLYYYSIYDLLHVFFIYVYEIKKIYIYMYIYCIICNYFYVIFMYKHANRKIVMH